jgi:hypothetical protein
MSKEKELTAFEELAKSMPENFELNDSDREHLEDEVRQLMKENIRAKITIQPLIEKQGTPNTFRNSSGSLYEYLVDNQICINCPGRLSQCPKKRTGYQLYPVYDKDRDEIKTELRECQLQHEKEVAISLIDPCYTSREAVYRKQDHLLATLRRDDNAKKMHDTAEVVIHALKLSQNFDKEKMYKGYHLRSINSQTLDRDVMMAITYIYTKAGLKVGYVNCFNFFAALVDKDWLVQDEAKRVYQKMCKVPVLMLENLNTLPNVNDEILITYLFGLLTERRKAGKITYCTTSTSVKVATLIYAKLKNLSCVKEAQDLAEAIFEEKDIKDFDLR